MAHRKNLTTLLLDLDGTLYDLPIDQAAMRADIAKILGRLPGPLGDLLQDHTEPHHTAVVGCIKAHELQAAKIGGPRAGATELLQSAGGTYKIAIVSRNAEAAIRFAAQRLGQPNITIVGREQVSALKPDPEGIHRALEMLASDPHQALVVGDTEHDVAAAHAAGIECVVVRNASLSFVPPGADRYVADLHELATILNQKDEA